MSYSVDFYAKSKEDALAFVADEARSHLPTVIRQLLTYTISITPDGPIHVKASGHETVDKSYPNSWGSFEVCPLMFIAETDRD